MLMQGIIAGKLPPAIIPIALNQSPAIIPIALNDLENKSKCYAF